MKVFLFQNFNLVTIFIILYLKIFKHKIFYINISRLFRNYAFINILKKFNIIWFNYQEFDLDNVETTQMLISTKHCEDISNILCHKFWSKYFEKIFLNKEFFQTCIYSGIEYKVRDAIELYLIADYLKKKESSTIILCAENSFINRKILNEQNLKNINKLRNFNILSLIKIKTFFNSLKKLITKNQKLKKNKIDEKDKNNDFKVVYFCHGILYRKLFVKDYFYSENIQSPFSASKILHIEWNKKSLSDSMIKYYKDKNLNYIIWNQKTSKFRIIKLLLIQMFQNKKYFFYNI